MTRYKIIKNNGTWRRKQHIHFNPLLSGRHAYTHSLVEMHWEHMKRNWRPSGEIILITPCSNVKPYPLSPMNTKIRKVLEKLGLWGNGKKVVDWIFISDLLGPVPYEYTWIEPACCYEAPPSIIEEDFWLREQVKTVIDEWWRRIRSHYKHIITYLPKKYSYISNSILKNNNPKSYQIPYNIFYGQREIYNKLLEIITQQ